ncbi:hypothetical protein [Kitasatospora kifunensis]|uniref:Uncharacterized protein n=1 Tax=Kitasatospora kifunensis TaxID=58351 RepID=A0A7W7R6D6_KITKI|nr:hypothetical protein [Kitasatospora kifunensis]MBB4926267.1 hypothetical protein [Kitasatospora kifunensis]
MTTAHRSPHPWHLNGASSALVDPYKRALPRRAPARLSTSSDTATTNRILLDEHRSQNGQCVRCETQWPCQVAIETRARSAA